MSNLSEPSSKKCKCKLCKRSCVVRKLAANLGADDRQVVIDLMNDLDDVEVERDYFKSIIAGKWPNADRIIKEARGEL